MKRMINNKNDLIIKNMKKRKIIRIFLIVFGLLTIILAIYSLITKFTFIPAVITFIIEAVLSKFYEKLDPKEVNLDLKNQE